MADLCLPIFPTETLAMTVTTTVWIGVCVVVLCNLRLGWTLSGLVVPGYVVPLLIVKPVSVVVILGEAMLTYGIVYVASERFNRLPHWSSFFGRDRFFVIILVSIIVRALTEGWILPSTWTWLNENFGVGISYRNDLHSFGLVIVALLANYFWKPGLRRSMPPVVICVGLTYVIVRYALAECTNFHLGSMEYIYDDIATSLLSSPKAYIILIATGYIASWINLRYSWEFNGILVPALLALSWYEPSKIFVSFCEAMLVLGLASAALKLPLWRRMTMEGGRKLLLFFTVCFLIRLLLSHLLPWLAPGKQVTDYFGTGYLISTLLAVKAHDRGRVIRIVKSTVQVSMIGGVAGSALGFLLTMLPITWATNESDPYQALTEPERLTGSLVDALRSDKVTLYQMRTPNSYVPPIANEIRCFSAGVQQLQEFLGSGDEGKLHAARQYLASANYSVHVLEDRYIYLREQKPARGGGVYVLDKQHRNGLCIEVPAPLDEQSSVESGLTLFQQLSAGSLAIAGAALKTNIDGSANVLATRRTLFAAFHARTHHNNVLQVRGYSVSNLKKVVPIAKSERHTALESLESSLWVRGRIPRSLDLRSLKDLLTHFAIHWRDHPQENVLRGNVSHGFAELYLNRRDRRALVSRLDHNDPDSPKQHMRRIDGSLYQWVTQRQESFARRGTNLYRPATLEELMFLDEEIIRPIIRSIRLYTAGRREDAWSGLAIASGAAPTLGYELVQFNDTVNDEELWILTESEPYRRHWGLYVFRPDAAEPYIVEVPRSLAERNAIEFGLSLFENTRGTLLAVAGCHPHTNLDGTSELARLENKVNAFNLVHQATLREVGRQPMLVAHARSIQAPITADVVVATDDGVITRELLSPLKSELLRLLDNVGLRTQFVDGTEETAGYELGIMLQSSLLNHTENKEIVSLWLSPSLRKKYQQQNDNLRMDAQFDVAGIPTILCDLWQDLAARNRSADPQGVPDALRNELLMYLDNQDVVRLTSISETWTEYEFTRLVDRGSGQSFLLVSREPQWLTLVANTSGSVGPLRTIVCDNCNREQVRRFVKSRATFLEFGAVE